MNFKIKKAIFGIVLAVILIIVIISLLPLSFLFLNNQIGIYLLVIYYLINMFFLFDVWFKERSDFRSRVSWTTLLLLVPGAGALIYYWGGFTPISIRKELKNLKLIKSEELRKNNFDTDFSNVNSIFKENFENQGRIVLDNTKLEFLNFGFEKFPILLKDLNKAEKFINIQYFIINDGIIWKQIEEVLLKKLEQGLEVNILIDYIGCLQTDDKSYEKIISAGANLVQFNKNSLTIKNGFANYRSHNKFVIIDNKITYFGGMNIGDDYSSLYPKYGTWFDLQVRVKGEMVNELNNHFIEQWNMFTKNQISHLENRKISFDEKTIVQFVDDGPYYEKTYFLNNLISLIKNSKEKIRFVSAYLILPNILIQELEKAVQRGVDVQIITAGRADKKSAYFVGKYFVSDLVSKGIKVFRMNNIFIHSKFYLFDNEMIITGTSNLDYRAIYMHFESNLLIQSEVKMIELERIFEEYKQNSHLQKAHFNPNKIIGKIRYAFIKLISPMF